MKCYNRLTGLKEVVDTSGVSNMLFGDAGQILIQRLYPKEFCEYNPIDSPVPTHVDIFEDCKYPLEIKWSGQKIYRIEDIPEGWMLQLMRYMALTKSEIGWMVIINLTSRQLTAFKIMMEQKELEEQYNLIVESRDRILQAAKDKNSSTLIVNLDECNWCPYRNRRGKDKSETCPKYVPQSRVEVQLPVVV
jgi:hypothetical protein